MNYTFVIGCYPKQHMEGKTVILDISEDNCGLFIPRFFSINEAENFLRDFMFNLTCRYGHGSKFFIQTLYSS